VEARRAINAVQSALAADSDLLNEAEAARIAETIEAVERAMSGVDRAAIQGAAEELEHRTKPFAEKRMDRGIRKALSGRAVSDLGV
jgi:molecular chaperone HscA